jgi:hypothetical protein
LPERPRRAAKPTLIPLPLSVLAQTDFEEYQEQGAAKPRRDEGNEKHLAGESIDQHAASRTGDDEHGG